MSNYSNNLKKIMALKDLTQQEVAEGIGCTRQAVARWQKGLSAPYGNNLQKLAMFLKVEPADLVFGDIASSNVKEFSPNEKPPKGYVAIPESRMCASAGNGYENEWEEVNTEEAVWYKEEFFRHRGINPQKCKRISASGDSMNPFICDGDKILFALDPITNISSVRDGSIYVLSIGGKLLVKRLATTKDTLIVRSENPLYQEERYSAEDLDSITIFGKVIEITRSI